MAINNLNPNTSWDPLTSTRPPIVGDIQQQYDVVRDVYRTAVFDGQIWQEIQPSNTAINANTFIPAMQSGTITASSVAPIANGIMNDFAFFFEKNVRVVEFVDSDNKVRGAQLQWRTEPGSEWQPIKRVKQNI